MNECPECGGELDFEPGCVGYHDEPATVDTSFCTNCDYRLVHDKWERAVEQADELLEDEIPW